MSALLRKIVVANIVLAGVLYLRRPLGELATLPGESLSHLLRLVAGYLAAAVNLVSPLASLWLLISSALLFVLLLVRTARRFAGESRPADDAAGGGFLADVLLVTLWLALYAVGYQLRWFS